MRLPDALIEAVKKAGVKVYFASRNTTRVWNSARLSEEPLRYGGWYWMREQRGRVTDFDEDGPFRSESAAIRDAFMKLQLRLPGLLVVAGAAFGLEGLVVSA